MKKSIIILCTSDLYFGNSAGASRMKNFAKALAKENSIYFLSSDRVNSYSKEKIIEIEKNIFVEAKGNRLKNNYLTKLFYPFYQLLFVIKTYSFSKKLNSKIVFYLYPSTKTLLDFIVAFYLIKMKNQKVFYEANEIRKFTPYLQNKESFFKSPTKYILRKTKHFKYVISEKLTTYYNGLLCISTNIESYLKKYNPRTLIIPILTNINNMVSESPKFYNDKESFIICFGGMINVKKENLEFFFAALGQLNEKYSKFEFHMYGPISSYDKNQIFNRLVKLYSLENKVHYMGARDQKELSIVYSKYHLLVIPRGFNLQNHYGFSTKLSEYLLSRVPVLVTNVSDNSLYIKDNFNGFIVEPDNSEIMADKLFEIINNYNKMVNPIIKNAENTIKEKFHYEVYSDKINDFLWQD